MLGLVSVVLTFAASFAALPVGVFIVEVLAAITLARWQRPASVLAGTRRRVAVLVPAHNEATDLLATLEDIKPQLQAGDRLIVIADNCTDTTPVLAVSAGAEVIERREPKKVGKGYALARGVEHLNMDPPDVVIVIDADCRVAKGCIDQLALTCIEYDRPVQALDLITAPDKTTVESRVAEFAWRIRNWVRPLGLWSLNLPCQLMGTGMAFPWKLLHSTNVKGGSLVEDLNLGLSLAAAGSAPLFCPSTAVVSRLPFSLEAASIQRQRWQQGHIQAILRMSPKLLYTAIVNANVDLLALTMDLIVPPLSLLAMLLVILFSLAILASFFGLSTAPLLISGVTLVFYIIGVTISWWVCGRDLLAPARILGLSPYLSAQLRLYRKILTHRTPPKWIRTDRGKR